jgi:diguanylate cyclase (GGDEF)-like protein
MIDLDNFKTINDTFGHMAGDAALKQVARILTQVVRRSDLLSRYGGDEFLALLPETDLEGADALAEKVRAATASQDFGDGDPGFQLTLSIGAATLSADESGNDMIVRADMALYDAKEQGRNRVERAGTKGDDAEGIKDAKKSAHGPAPDFESHRRD